MSRMNKSKNFSAFELDTTLESVHTGGPLMISKYNFSEVLITHDSKNIYYIDTENGQKMVTLSILGDADQDITSVFVNSDHVYVSLSNSLIECRNLRNGHILKSWKGPNSPVLCMAHHSKSHLLATGTSDNSIKIWDSLLGFCTHNLKGIHGGLITSLLFGSSESQPELFSAADDGSIVRWNLSSGQGKLLKSHVSSVRSMDINADGSKLVSVGRDKIITVWDLVDNKVIKTIPSSESLECVVFVDSNSFLAAGETGVVRLWDAETCRNIRNSEKLTVQEHGFTHGTFSGNKIFLTSSDLQIFCVGFERLNAIFSIVGSFGEITDLSFLNDRSLVVVTNDPAIKVYPSHLSLKCDILNGHVASVLCIATYENWILSGSRDNTAKLWLRENGRFRLVDTLLGHTDSISAVYLNVAKNGKMFLVTASADTTLKCWDLCSTENNEHRAVSRWTKKAHEKDINSIAVTPNFKYLITASQDKTARIWRIEDGELISTLSGHKRGLWSVKCSPREQIIATASADKTIKLWSATTFTCLKTLEGHSNSVLSVSFLQNGTELLSCGSDGLIKIWDLKSSSCVSTYDEHLDRIWTHSLFGESFLASGDASGVVKIWKNSTQKVRLEMEKSEEDRLLMYHTNLCLI